MEEGWKRKTRKDSHLQKDGETKDGKQMNPFVDCPAALPPLFPHFLPYFLNIKYLLTSASVLNTHGSETEESEMLKLKALCLAFIKSLVGKGSWT